MAHARVVGEDVERGLAAREAFDPHRVDAVDGHHQVGPVHAEAHPIGPDAVEVDGVGALGVVDAVDGAVLEPADLVAIGTGTALEAVAAPPACEHVVTLAAIEDVVTVPTAQDVVAALADENVVGAAAEDDVVLVVAEDRARVALRRRRVEPDVVVRQRNGSPCTRENIPILVRYRSVAQLVEAIGRVEALVPTLRRRGQRRLRQSTVGPERVVRRGRGRLHLEPEDLRGLEACHVAGDDLDLVGTGLGGAPAQGGAVEDEARRQRAAVRQARRVGEPVAEGQIDVVEERRHGERRDRRSSVHRLVVRSVDGHGAVVDVAHPQRQRRLGLEPAGVGRGHPQAQDTGVEVPGCPRERARRRIEAQPRRQGRPVGQGRLEGKRVAVRVVERPFGQHPAIGLALGRRRRRRRERHLGRLVGGGHRERHVHLGDRTAAVRGADGERVGPIRRDVGGDALDGAAGRIEEEPVRQSGCRQGQRVAVRDVDIGEEIIRQRDRDDVALGHRHRIDAAGNGGRVVDVGDMELEALDIDMAGGVARPDDDGDLADPVVVGGAGEGARSRVEGEPGRQRRAVRERGLEHGARRLGEAPLERQRDHGHVLGRRPDGKWRVEQVRQRLDGEIDRRRPARRTGGIARADDERDRAGGGRGGIGRDAQREGVGIEDEPGRQGGTVGGLDDEGQQIAVDVEEMHLGRMLVGRRRLGRKVEHGGAALLHHHRILVVGVSRLRTVVDVLDLETKSRGGLAARGVPRRDPDVDRAHVGVARRAAEDAVLEGEPVGKRCPAAERGVDRQEVAVGVDEEARRQREGEGHVLAGRLQSDRVLDGGRRVHALDVEVERGGRGGTGRVGGGHLDAVDRQRIVARRAVEGAGGCVEAEPVGQRRAVREPRRERDRLALLVDEEAPRELPAVAFALDGQERRQLLAGGQGEFRGVVHRGDLDVHQDRGRRAVHVGRRDAHRHRAVVRVVGCREELARRRIEGEKARFQGRSVGERDAERQRVSVGVREEVVGQRHELARLVLGDDPRVERRRRHRGRVRPHLEAEVEAHLGARGIDRHEPEAERRRIAVAGRARDGAGRGIEDEPVRQRAAIGALEPVGEQVAVLVSEGVVGRRPGERAVRRRHQRVRCVAHQCRRPVVGADVEAQGRLRGRAGAVRGHDAHGEGVDVQVRRYRLEAPRGAVEGKPVGQWRAVGHHRLEAQHVPLVGVSKEARGQGVAVGGAVADETLDLLRRRNDTDGRRVVGVLDDQGEGRRRLGAGPVGSHEPDVDAADVLVRGRPAEGARRGVEGEPGRQRAGLDGDRQHVAGVGIGEEAVGQRPDERGVLGRLVLQPGELRFGRIVHVDDVDDEAGRDRRTEAVGRGNLDVEGADDVVGRRHGEAAGVGVELDPVRQRGAVGTRRRQRQRLARIDVGEEPLGQSERLHGALVDRAVRGLAGHGRRMVDAGQSMHPVVEVEPEQRRRRLEVGDLEGNGAVDRDLERAVDEGGGDLGHLDARQRHGADGVDLGVAVADGIDTAAHQVDHIGVGARSAVEQVGAAEAPEAVGPVAADDVVGVAVHLDEPGLWQGEGAVRRLHREGGLARVVVGHDEALGAVHEAYERGGAGAVHVAADDETERVARDPTDLDDVGAGIVVDDVQGVLGIGENEAVVAGATQERVGAGTTGEHIVAGAAVELVRPGAALEAVVTLSAVQHIVAVTAEQHVVAGVAVEHVVAAMPLDPIVAGTARGVVVALVAHQHVVAVGGAGYLPVEMREEAEAARLLVRRDLGVELGEVEQRDGAVGVDLQAGERDAAATLVEGRAPGRRRRHLVDGGIARAPSTCARRRARCRCRAAIDGGPRELDHGTGSDEHVPAGRRSGTLGVVGKVRAGSTVRGEIWGRGRLLHPRRLAQQEQADERGCDRGAQGCRLDPAAAAVGTTFGRMDERARRRRSLGKRVHGSHPLEACVAVRQDRPPPTSGKKLTKS